MHLVSLIISCPFSLGFSVSSLTKILQNTSRKLNTDISQIKEISKTYKVTHNFSNYNKKYFKHFRFIHFLHIYLSMLSFTLLLFFEISPRHFSPHKSSTIHRQSDASSFSLELNHDPLFFFSLPFLAFLVSRSPSFFFLFPSFLPLQQNSSRGRFS